MLVSLCVVLSGVSVAGSFTCTSAPATGAPALGMTEGTSAGWTGCRSCGLGAAAGTVPARSCISRSPAADGPVTASSDGPALAEPANKPIAAATAAAAACR
jgi:hypothetical protein